MSINLHDKPFDEGTLKKLEIFEMYTKQWLPTFIMSEAETICIYDFFAGTGYDIVGELGSPIRILRQIKEQIGHIFNKQTHLYLIFNEFNKEKANKLEKACKDFILSDSELRRANESNLLCYKIFNEDFSDLFPKQIRYINKYPSLVFLDQNGVKFLDDKFFIPLINSQCTDFIYFVSSSYVRRFYEDLSQYIDYDIKQAEKEPTTWIHRNIIEQLRKKIPEGNETKLYPFTLKKGPNIYGIIFGASHPRAVDKFLDTAWKENEINGEANFDIDNDTNKGMKDLFGNIQLTKIQKFQKDLREKILSKELRTNKDVYLFTLEQGHIPVHATEELKLMKQNGLITFGRSPMINYNQVYKRKNIITYTIK